MDDDDVIEAAEGEGFGAVLVPGRRGALRRFVRGDDLRCPAFSEGRHVTRTPVVR
jgi:hypothetical protein